MRKHVVLYWVNENDTVPEILGPYSAPEEALKIRNQIREKQNRTNKPAQSTIMSKTI